MELGDVMENFLLLGSMGLIVVGIASSLHSFWTNPSRRHYLSLQNLIVLIYVYLILLLGFGLAYMILDLLQFTALTKDGEPISGSFLERLESSLYFSAVTVLTVGYGDVTPIGIGKWVAMLEAMIGYLLPAAFVVRTFIEHDKK
jgi:potassium channel LctB